MNREVRQRLQWVKLYEKHGDAGYVCRRCGISRPTLRKWWRRYQEAGLAGLESQSRRPLRSPAAKIGPHEEGLILDLRHSRNLGARRIQSELRRQNDLFLGLATIHKVLQKHQVKPVRKYRYKKDFIRYERPIPGERVQMDTCQVGKGLIQYTSVDDCTRYRVLRLYNRRTAENTLEFIDCVLEEMPFPIQRFQTDRGREFFAEKVQKRLMEYGIKFRPNKPGSPHLNGKVERSQKTDKFEFYATIDMESDELPDRLSEWQHYYNWSRPHSAHGGKSPMERFFDSIHDTPFWDEVYDLYDPEKERIPDPNYKLDLRLEKVKRSL